MNIHRLQSLGRGLAILLGLMVNIACADDIEIFDNPGITGGKPNVLFVFDISGSMDEPTPSDPSKTKLQSMREAVETVLRTPGLDINAGYINFGKWRGRGIKFPVVDIADDAHDYDASIPAGTTVRDVLINMINSDSVSGQTPTVDALYESALYFRGDKLDLGASGSFGTWRTNRTPPHYVGGNWKAANPAAYSGARTVIDESVPLDTPIGGDVSERWCERPVDPNEDWDDCAGIPDSHLDCTTVPAEPEVCNGTKMECVQSRVTYPVVSACIDGPGASGSTWFNSNQHKCCTSADATNTECLSWKNLRREECLEEAAVPDCTGGHTAYRECRWLRRHSVEDTRRYNSPISQCGANMIVLLSDGAPSKNGVDYGRKWSNGNARGPSKIRNLIATGTNAVMTDSSTLRLTRHDVECADLSASIFNQSPNSYVFGNCGPELANFLSTVNQIPGVEGSTVNTYTIGFGLTGTGAVESQNYLRLLAQEGNGFFAEADSTQTLVDAMRAAIA
ncbi:MAG TPA: VWA domain-containing protein, partial [Gammaproteobacteria bacterium]|nr:VWA domain-containing protein [Gammaproteobacteria bacterium]